MIMPMMMMVVLSYADNDKDFHDADTLRRTDAHCDEDEDEDKDCLKC